MRRKKDFTALALALVLSLCIGIFSMSSPTLHAAADTPTVPADRVTLQADENVRSAESIFTDIQADIWYADAVTYCAENGLMTGTSDTLFSPGTSMTRAMLATVLYRAAGSPEAGESSFTDVAADMWYSDAIAWAEENDIVGGYGNGTFGTNHSVTREQITTILWRYAESPNASASVSFEDSGSISSWAVQSVSWAVEQEVILGKPGNIFDPRGYATRAEVAAIFYRYLSDDTSNPPDGTEPTVFMTDDISPDGLMAIYEALGVSPTGDVAVKVHTGEPGGQNFLRPEFMQELVQSVDGTIVESNTAYGGQRASTAMHYQLAEDHGFTAIAPVVILDEADSMAIPVQNGTYFSENLVGARLADFDSLITLSHFKGHAIGGYGGALKNMSIGIASTAGKNRIHTAGSSDTQWMGGDQDEFLESMAEATLSVVDYFDGNVLYINVMNRMSVDCDCSGAMAAEPEVHDIGILASTDPVALDKACIDLIYAVDDGTADSLIARIEDRNGLHVIEHGEAIGLGSTNYTLVHIDD